MKILVAGDWHSELHEEPVFQAFRKLGQDVARFAWNGYFAGAGHSPAKRFQNKFIVGPLVSRLNRDFLRQVDEYRPDCIFIYRGTHIVPSSIRKVKRRHPRTILLGYNNDDPFAPNQSRFLWRHFVRGIPYYDLMLAYRHHNLDEFSKAGARRVELLRSWYVPQRNHAATLTPEDKVRFDCDVVFIGHYEDDGRLACLEETVRQGFRLRLFGPGYDWDPVIASSMWLQDKRPVRLVWGEEYNKALCGAKIALCFLSKLNRDTYTRRCFEIPAAGVMMLAERTDDLETLFRPGIEADFFRSPGEMMEKIKHYVENDSLRHDVAAAGHRRVVADGHDVVSRMQRVLSWVRELNDLERHD